VTRSSAGASAQIRLLHLSTGEVITVRPSEQSIQFLPRRTAAVLAGVEGLRRRRLPASPGRARDYCAFGRGAWPSAATRTAPAWRRRPRHRCGATPPRPRGRRPGGRRLGRFATRAARRRFDAWFDAALDHIRGNAVADRVFYTASAVGDMSMLWHIIGAARAAIDPDRLGDAARLSATLGVESLLVNQGVKRLFKRGRPVFDGTRPHRLRTPSTTSFPSGHASAAFCAAVILSGRIPATPPSGTASPPPSPSAGPTSTSTTPPTWWAAPSSVRPRLARALVS
jgi:undecaprenyl-diphosphatase